LKSWIFVAFVILLMHDKRIKFEPREQMNRTLKPGGVRILNLSRVKFILSQHLK